MVNRDFIDALASKSPTPGGGGASAYCGALASALASMVGNLTLGKKKYADIEADVVVTQEKLAAVRERLLELVEEDAEAFEPLARAYGMPKGTPEEQEAKNAALQQALVGACEVPLEIMRTCKEVIELSEFYMLHGSRLALSDVGVAAVFAKAALQGAALNVFINVSSMDDVERAAAYRKEAEMLIETFGDKADHMYHYVVKEVG